MLDLPPPPLQPGASAGRGVQRDRGQPAALVSPGVLYQPVGQGARWISVTVATVVLVMVAAATAIMVAYGGKNGARTGTSIGASVPMLGQGTGMRAQPGKGHSRLTLPGSASSDGRRQAPGSQAQSRITLVAVASGGTRVFVAPTAAGGPHLWAVAHLLAGYLSAINTQDYQAYSQLFMPSERGSLSSIAFAAGNGSAPDTRATLLSIRRVVGSDRMMAAVTLVSHQQPAASPSGSACTAWHLSMYLIWRGGRLLIMSPPQAYGPAVARCR